MLHFSKKLRATGTIWLSCLLSISAKIYYVNNSDTSACSNSVNGGTASQPWCTIDYALKQIKGGDTLRIKKGVYAHQYTLTIPATVSGTKEKPTLIEAFGDDSVLIRGPGVNGGRVAITGVSWLFFRKITVTDYNQGIFIQQGSQELVLDSCAVHGVGQEAIHVKEHSHHITIQNCKIHDTKKWKYNGEGIYIGTGSAGPVDTTNTIIVKNCTIYNTADEAIELKPGTLDCIAENNRIFNVTMEGVWGAIEINQHTAGVQAAPREPKHIVRNNEIYNVTCSGIRAGTGCTVYNNVIYGAKEYGILCDNASKDSWTRNIYHNTVDLPSDKAVRSAGGTADVKNNIGPSMPDNIAVNGEWFIAVQKVNRDYHLKPGAAAVNAGINLLAVVPVDKDGIARDGQPDMGAYEYRQAHTIPGKIEPSMLKNGGPDCLPQSIMKLPGTKSGGPIFTFTGKENVYSLSGWRLNFLDAKSNLRLPNGIYIFHR